MTVKELVTRLGAHDGELPVVIRCQWEGDVDGEAPPHSEFYPHVVVRGTDADTAEDFIAITCDQEGD